MTHPHPRSPTATHPGTRTAAPGGGRSRESRCGRTSTGRRRRPRCAGCRGRRARGEPSSRPDGSRLSFLAMPFERYRRRVTVPFLIEDTVPRPILTDGPCPTWMCAFLAAARVIDTVAIPLAGAFDVTRSEMPLRSTALRLCGSSCSRTWRRRRRARTRPEPEDAGGGGACRSSRGPGRSGVRLAALPPRSVTVSSPDSHRDCCTVIDARTGAAGAVAEVPLVSAVVDHQRRGGHRPVEQDAVAGVDRRSARRARRVHRTVPAQGSAFGSVSIAPALLNSRWSEIGGRR